jgi:hypothetical protein
MAASRPLAALASVILAGVAAAAPVEQGGLPGGGTFAALRPASWSQDRLLLVAPAQRTDDQPALASLDARDPLVAPLLADGWMVATVGYRRTGIVLKDGLDDLGALRALLAQRHGAADRTYVLGEGLGGAIAVRAVEHRPDDFSGALVVGGPFDLQEPAPTVGISFTPQRPLLLLPNQSENHAPLGYAAAASGVADRPVVWTIRRDGRGNTRAVEKLAALAALVRWVEDGVAPRADFDPTIPAPPRPSVARFSSDDASATGRVVAIDPLRGDLTLDLQPADLDRLRVARGSFFALVVAGPGGAERIVRVLHGQNLRDAKRGDWMALPEAEGGLLVFVHRGSAAANAGLRAGDTVTVRRLRGD